PMRGLIRCTNCKRVYSPYTKKGILYFYARCVEGCPNSRKSINFDYISDVIKNFIQDLHFTEDEKEKLDAQVSTDIALLEEQRNLEIEKRERSRKRVRDELSFLRSKRLKLIQTGVYTPEEYVAELAKLEDEHDHMLEDDGISELAMREVIKDVITLSELLELTVSIYENAEPTQKEKIARKVFSELYISEDKLSFKLNPGFTALEMASKSNCALMDTLSELYAERESVQTNIEALQIFVR
ncbi:MAG: zinc ribbon domain-containing protein, partial [Sphingorhabdus sp.]